MTAIEPGTGALPLDPEEARRVRAARLERIGKWLLPLAIMVLAIWLWDRICVWNEIPRYILPRPGVVLATLYTDAGLLFSLAAGDAAHHLPRPRARGRRRRRAGRPLRPVEMGGDVVLPLRRHPAGHADRRDLPADQHLCRQPDGEAPALRLDRRLLPDPLQHHARAELRRPQSASTFSSSTARPAGSSSGICACRPRCPISSAA